MERRIVISNYTINRHTQNMKQLKTSSMRAEEAKSHYSKLINTLNMNSKLINTLI